MAIADVYDAMSSKRIYKEAYPHEKCVEMICEESGKQFDPVLVEVFLKLESEFREIARNCRDATEARNADRRRAEISESLPRRPKCRSTTSSRCFEATARSMRRTISALADILASGRLPVLDAEHLALCENAVTLQPPERILRSRIGAGKCLVRALNSIDFWNSS